MGKKKIEYVFRGTTIGYKGNPTNRRIPVICTSSNPIFALFFALECANNYPDTSVIYIARMDALEGHLFPGNVLETIEEEVVFNLKSEEFYTLAEGYVTYKELRSVVLEMGVTLPSFVNLSNLTNLCSGSKKLKKAQLKNMITKLQPLLKNT